MVEREQHKDLAKSREHNILWAVAMTRTASEHPEDRVEHYKGLLDNWSKINPQVKQEIDFLQGLPDKEFGRKFDKAFKDIKK